MGEKAGKFWYGHYTTGWTGAPKGQAPCQYTAALDNNAGMPWPAVGCQPLFFTSPLSHLLVWQKLFNELPLWSSKTLRPTQDMEWWIACLKDAIHNQILNVIQLDGIIALLCIIYKPGCWSVNWHGTFPWKTSCELSCTGAQKRAAQSHTD